MATIEDVDAALRRHLARRERDLLFGTLAVEDIVSPTLPRNMDIMADFLAAKAAIAALPPPLLAVKCHPADVAVLRRTAVPLPFFGSVTLFRNLRVPRGQYLAAFDRATVDEWRREEWRGELLTVLRRRLAALAEREEVTR